MTNNRIVFGNAAALEEAVRSSRTAYDYHTSARKRFSVFDDIENYRHAVFSAEKHDGAFLTQCLQRASQQRRLQESDTMGPLPDGPVTMKDVLQVRANLSQSLYDVAIRCAARAFALHHSAEGHNVDIRETPLPKGEAYKDISSFVLPEVF